ncbi:hypothetical protein VTN77DRAFT_2629 [Rasamsonia byssochlamydoides]|uniref:uncharacterized protein n=1 Tax=Rasamsonia byssochlamydoides TaxID=89139 RepID=UPI003743E8AA
MDALDNEVNVILLIIITVFIPPLGVFLLSGCSTDLLINILLTILGYFPGHIHAFYLEYVYYDRRKLGPQGGIGRRPAPGVYSQKIQNGGYPPQGYGNYGTME